MLRPRDGTEDDERAVDQPQSPDHPNFGAEPGSASSCLRRPSPSVHVRVNGTDGREVRVLKGSDLANDVRVVDRHAVTVGIAHRKTRVNAIVLDWR